jgi:gamma-glutamyltranspeptidase/glutathione hydrolase
LTRGIVATPHHLASEAGAHVLREGGNAVDAAVAANAVLCVVYPHMTSIGGDLFAMVWPAGAGAPVGLEGAGRSGSNASLEAVRRLGHERMPATGPLTVTVPGTVAAWGALIERYGTLGLAPLMEPAAAHARDGYVVTENLSRALHENFEWLQEDPAAQRLLPPMKAGMTLRNPELAETLTAIGRSGFIEFYRGEIGKAIVRTLEARGGLLAATDLGSHRSVWVDPIAFPYRDLTVYEMPPPSQGLVAAGMLVRLARLGAERLRPGLGFARELVRVRDQVYALRDRLIGDPGFAEVPVGPFLDPDFDAGGGGEAIPEGDTIYLCAADEHGNLVSLIQSVANAFGSGVIAEGTGVVLQNRGVYFSLDPGHVNRLEPGKKTMHTLIPALAGRGGRPWAAFGNMGADGQPQFQAQVFVGLADLGLDPQAAVAAPRLRVPAGGGGLWVEADYPEALEIARALNAELKPPRSSLFGHAQAIVVDGPGAWRGGADPRADGSVAAAE